MKILDKNITRKNILILGDVMLDRYYAGVVKRISPEAPVPIFLENKIMVAPGGAGNVAINVRAAEQKVSVASVVGRDSDGKELVGLLENKGIDCSMILYDSKRPTTVKNRYLGDNHQQILRHDRETVEELSMNLQKKLFLKIQFRIKECDIVVISDYAKGVCAEYLLQLVIRECNIHKKKVLVDVKGKDASKYKGSYLVKPNRRELYDLMEDCYSEGDDIVEVSRALCQRCDAEYVVTTCGSDGMIAVNQEGNSIKVESIAKEVFDVTSAGDTVLAFMAMGIANGIAISEVLKISNIAASIQVSRVGTSVISIKDVNEATDNSNCKKKIFSVDELVDILNERKNRKVVFTNGCYDIIHLGHIQSLERAAELGDILIVAINDDESVSRLKGKLRPINSLQDRMEVVASIEYVDYVTSFGDDTPYEVISKIKPDILVKGADYKEEDVVGRDVVEAYGGKVVLVPYMDGRSTTRIINKIDSML